ncbi:MAG: bifunctional phosphoribosylaminoimidazolecarboxamide formyltransferase/IMP cyclohydrolase PurH [Halobacteriovoraceae bacterium]|nr:bifunctional phosphoribosylaminoimidazolecarboxamide formyltransferase/IMP cyclohydrolase PurH [Halobacteriovoraceae bacterium]|tara:strand:- start:5269 stop:6828 length:1560 start_codon:yes stop_codon:yes gene_type:complete
MTIKRALLSVSDKTQIVELAHFLKEQNVEIISTGGTAQKLIENGIAITPIQEITGNPESFGGRMKTISFEIGSSLLFRRDHKSDLEDAKNLNIQGIDLVVCNLYPFEDVAKNHPDDLARLIENIDIGGPTMLRAAAKNYQYVSVLSSPNQYQEFKNNFENIENSLRLKWSCEAFTLTAHYDQLIQNVLAHHCGELSLPLRTNQLNELRYGENPHQKAWLAPLHTPHQKENQLACAQKLHGKELSFNNWNDTDAAWKCMSELHHHYSDQFITVVVKHANPCGVAVSQTSLTSLTQAWACDPVSSFGSIISTNKTVDIDFANWLGDKFVEIITAPDFTEEALEKLQKKKNLRLLKVGVKPQNSFEKMYKSINGALLIQEEDERCHYEYKAVTKNQIPSEMAALKTFGMICNKYLKSNSICLVGEKEDSLVIAGSGMGQPNRLDSLKLLAAPRAKQLGFNLEQTLLISDAFFPFRDSIDIASETGVKFIIQPGGSIRDEEVIAACEEHGIAMEFTHTRHFRH